jgi:glycosyltransferase involved in cell wall biosynthesis
MSETVKISIVIPVFNNEATLQELTKRITATLPTCENTYEILFINDGSRDKSLSILKELAYSMPEVKVINLSRNFGQHPAICAGFEHSRGEITILMDADLQDRPEYIVDLVRKLLDEGADVAYTIKKSDEKKLTSRVTSSLYHYIFSRIVNTEVPLNIGTFRAFNRKFLQALLQFKEVNVLYGPLMFFMGFKSSFLELPYHERPHGKSSYTFRKRLQLAVNSLISYTDIPHRLSMMFGMVLFLVSLLYGLIFTLEYFLFGASLPGGMTLILLVLCLTLGSLMMSLGVIGSYVFRVYQETLSRPRYLVQETFNIAPDRK